MSQEAAKLVATLAHKGQMYGKHPYTYHLQMVEDILVHYGYGHGRVTAGWLHDILEDTDVTFDQILEAFGPYVAVIVEACTGRGVNRVERNASIREKLAQQPSARAVKLADRMANIHSCLVDNNTRLLGMYLKEDSEFRPSVEDRAKDDMLEDYGVMVLGKKPLPWLINQIWE